MRRRYLLISLGLLVLAALAVAFFTPSPRPTAKRAAQVSVGMTPAQVEALLGPPTTVSFFRDDVDKSGELYWVVAEWEPSGGYIVVVYHCDGVVSHSASFDPSLWERLGRHFGFAW
jgi:SmpA / OmlA family